MLEYKAENAGKPQRHKPKDYHMIHTRHIR